MSEQKPTQEVWYKSPWALMIWGLLLICVVGNLVTIAILAKHTPDEVNHAWYRKGIKTYHSKVNGQQALAAKINALVTIDKVTGDVIVTLGQAKSVHYKKLTLLLEHPIHAKYDQLITLHPVNGERYQGELQARLKGKRYLLLKPGNNAWQLAKTVFFPKASIRLSPQGDKGAA